MTRGCDRLSATKKPSPGKLAALDKSARLPAAALPAIAEAGHAANADSIIFQVMGTTATATR